MTTPKIPDEKWKLIFDQHYVELPEQQYIKWPTDTWLSRKLKKITDERSSPQDNS